MSSRPPEECWLLYALGGGLGHLGRAVALVRRARRRGRRFLILTNSPFAGYVPVERELGASATVVRIDPSFERERVAVAVKEVFESARPSVIVVDTFPRGLGGELPALLDGLRCPSVLIRRDVAPSYWNRPEVRESASRFDRWIIPGESTPPCDGTSARSTLPWLARDSSEILGADEARRALGVGPGTLATVLVIGSGRLAEVAESGSIARRLHQLLRRRAVVRFATVLDVGGAVAGDPPTVRHWPLMETYRAVDLVVGSGGYPCVHECRATGTPLRALARPRLYDRQDRRLRPDERAGDLDDLIGRVEAWIDGRGGRSREAVPSFENGTHLAVDWIEKLI